jgi:Cu(I)/Ag(I) efflux system membrane protein CusA/SilA
MIRSENGRLSAFVYIDVRGRDSRRSCAICSAGRREQLPAGVSVAYSGQFEYLARAASG